VLRKYDNGSETREGVNGVDPGLCARLMASKWGCNTSATCPYDRNVNPMHLSLNRTYLHSKKSLRAPSNSSGFKKFFSARVGFRMGRFFCAKGGGIRWDGVTTFHHAVL
jgi:hypothetical protein